MRRMCVLLVAVGVVGVAGALPAAAAPWVGTTSVTGALDTVTSDGPSVTLTGWARDPGSAQPAEIHVYDSGPEGTVGYSGYKTSVPRPDVAAVFGGSGTTGYAITLPLSAGTHQICAFAIGRSSQALLGCRSIAAPPPFGVIDSYQDAATTGAPVAAFAGWAIDPAQSSTPLAVHVYDYAPDGQVTATAFASTVDRPDVAAVFGSGPTQGFAVAAPLSATLGEHRVCLFAISATGGTNGVLGCRIVTVYPPVLGNLDVTGPAAVGAVGLAGWAVDPLDPTTPVQITVTGALTAESGAAALPRPDVAAALPGAGPDHGFIAIQGLGLGSSQVCAVTVDAGDVIGCGTVTMSNGLGYVDSATAADGSIEVAGWALDPYLAADVPSTSLVVQVVADGGSAVEPQAVQVVTDEERSDVNDTLGLSGTYGFSLSVGGGELAPGEYTVNLWAPLLLKLTADTPTAGVPFASVKVTVT